MENTNKKIRKKFLALTLGIALLGTVFGMALSVNLQAAPTASAESLTQLSMQGSTSTDLDSPFKAVYNEVSPSVVGIQINAERRAMNGRIVANSAFVGSGVVISDEGYVVTNYHVVTAGGTEVAEDISVIYDGEEYTAKYVAGDADSDIAVLQVKDLSAPAVRLGNSDELSVGDWALVIGNPLGEMFTNTLTVGIISGVDRTISSSRGSSAGTTLIQTDAAINSGNSGGGLFNIQGELIGITSSKMSNNGYYGSASIEGIGLAIPVNTVTKIADDLIEYGKVMYPRIGVTVQPVTSTVDEPTSEYLPNCLWVRKVDEGGPADVAGIQVDDMIMEINGTRVKTSDEMLSLIRAQSVGDTVEVTVYRIPNLNRVGENDPYPEGEYLTFEVELQILDD